MELKIIYFGMIAEAISRTEEIILVPEYCDLNKLYELLKNRYKQLHKLSFTIAVDKEIPSDNKILIPKNEIALLPPFSGG